MLFGGVGVPPKYNFFALCFAWVTLTLFTILLQLSYAFFAPLPTMTIYFLEPWQGGGIGGLVCLEQPFQTIDMDENTKQLLIAVSVGVVSLVSNQADARARAQRNTRAHADTRALTNARASARGQQHAQTHTRTH